jgi:RimJ/RimL family protein N-acetyltransferase
VLLPIDTAPLLGAAVRLPLVTRDEAALMLDGGRLHWFAESYPRKDDLDAIRMSDGSAWSARHVICRADGLAVGSIGFFGPPSADGQVEVGYGLVEAARGQGLATDALTVIVAAAEAAGARIIAHTSADNVPSQRVLARCGFVRDDGRTNAAGDWRYVRPVTAPPDR